MKKIVFTSLILMIILVGVIYQPHPIQAVESPHPSISHCTDLDVAKWRTTDHSNPANAFIRLAIIESSKNYDYPNNPPLIISSCQRDCVIIKRSISNNHHLVPLFHSI